MNHLAPHPNDYPNYYHTYVSKVNTQKNIIDLLQEAQLNCIDFLKNIPNEKWDFRYAADKWTIKEVILHLIDTERIMAYRALRMARNDETPLPGFEQDDYVPFSAASERSPASIIEEYETVRKASISLFQYMNPNMLARKGTASNGQFTVLSFAYIIAGHEIHHLNVLGERYLT